MRLVEHAVRTRVRFLRRGQKPPPPAESAALGRVSAHHNKQGKALPLCPARKLGFRRWGKHSAWLSARTSPPPAAYLRAEARTHFLVAKSALLGTPTGKGKEIRKRKNTENET